MTPLPSGVSWKAWRNAAEQASGLAVLVAEALRQTIEHQGHALLVVPGGRSPVAFLEALSCQPLAWSKVQICPTDERCLPESHPDSNAGLLGRHLLQNAAASAHLVRLYQSAVNPEAAAQSAEQVLQTLPLPIDVLVLGMGEDGHTASLFPGSPGLSQALDQQNSRRCLPMLASSQPQSRLTLTRAVLQGARLQLLAIQGARKLETLQQALREMNEQRMPISAFLQAPLSIHWSP